MLACFGPIYITKILKMYPERRERKKRNISIRDIKIICLHPERPPPLPGFANEMIGLTASYGFMHIFTCPFVFSGDICLES